MSSAAAAFSQQQQQQHHHQQDRYHHQLHHHQHNQQQDRDRQRDSSSTNDPTIGKNPHAIQGYVTSYAPRLRQYANALIHPVAAPATATTATPGTRTTKRGTTVVNYAENDYDDDDFEEYSDTPRRAMGLRSLRRDESLSQSQSHDRERERLPPPPPPPKVGEEVDGVVDVQPNFREWVVKKVLKPNKAIQKYTQAHLPLVLVPIRIDVEVPAHTPLEPFYLPRNFMELGINPAQTPYRKPNPAPPYRIKDAFLWNLHEALITPEEFAVTMVRDLDFPNIQALSLAVSSQIRQQLEEYAGVALHPLFQTSATGGGAADATTKNSRNASSNHIAGPRPLRDESVLTTTTTTMPAPTDMTTPIDQDDNSSTAPAVDDELNHDDAYRCVVNLNINLHNQLYTDKFEWSLLHSQGAADEFARVTCADLGLPAEWVGAVSHGICEAVLRLKKEVFESGTLSAGNGISGLDNQAVFGGEAGWRYDPDSLGAEWEPRVEVLSKEEIERREGDRERQLRRMRRETAKFSSTATVPVHPYLASHHAEGSRQTSYSIFDPPDNGEAFGRGERSKKKRRFRSISPGGGRAGTPSGRGGGSGSGGGAAATETSGFGGGGGTLAEWERHTWRCSNCLVWGTAVWAVRDGPAGPGSLCHNCGYLYERNKELPVWQRELHRRDVPIGR